MKWIPSLLMVSAIAGLYALNHWEHRRTVQRVEALVDTLRMERNERLTAQSTTAERVYMIPLSGNEPGYETVFDAIRNNRELSTLAAKGTISVIRTMNDRETTLPVDWVGMTQRGVTTTNYVLMPGDRLVVASGRS